MSGEDSDGNGEEPQMAKGDSSSPIADHCTVPLKWGSLHRPGFEWANSTLSSLL